jgi:hypothetical protein
VFHFLDLVLRRMRDDSEVLSGRENAQTLWMTIYDTLKI